MNDTVKSAYNAFLEHYKASENKDNNLLCLLVGGSTLYGLNNKNSDIDIRGVYALSRRSQVLGLGLYGKRSFESFVMNTDEVDAALHEFRHFIYLLSKTNTTVLDVLYAPEDAFIVNYSEYITKIRKNPTRLIDTGQLYNSMKGYVHNEIRLMLGERSGKLGGKRKTNLDTYGYSYKNLVQVMRLSFAARKFFETGVYPVRISDWDKEFHNSLMDIKTNPSKYSYEFAKDIGEGIIPAIEDAYKNRTIDLTFDYTYANDLIDSFYTMSCEY